MSTIPEWKKHFQSLLDDRDDGLLSLKDVEQMMQEKYPGNYRLVDAYSWTKLECHIVLKFNNPNDKLLFEIKYS